MSKTLSVIATIRIAVILTSIIGAFTPARAAEGDLREIKLGLGGTQYQLLVNFPAAGTKCLRYMDGADGTTVGKALGCFKMGPQFVVDSNGFLTIPLTKGDPGAAGRDGSPGAQGNPGQMGATGMTGAQGEPGSQGPRGADGAQGPKGDQGVQGVPGGSGVAGTTGATGPAGTKGDTGATGPAGPAGTQVLRLRATTAADGSYTWTFPTPFAAGTLPVIAVAAEGSATMNYQHTITAVSNTSVTIRVVPVADVTLLGIHILGIQSAQAANVHLIATPAP